MKNETLLTIFSSLIRMKRRKEKFPLTFLRFEAKARGEMLHEPFERKCSQGESRRIFHARVSVSSVNLSNEVGKL